jgi:hypothetical protein
VRNAEPLTDRLLTPGEAATLLATTPKALDHRRRAGEIAYVSLGRLVRYRESAVLRFIDDHTTTFAPRRRGRPTVVRMPRHQEGR